MDDKIFMFTDADWVVPELRDFFAFPATRQKIAEIARRDGVPEAKVEKTFVVVRDVVRGKVAPDELTSALIEQVGIDFDVAIEVHGDLAAELFPDVEELLEEQAGIYRDMHPEDFLPPPPPEADVSEEIAQGIAERSGIAPKDPVLRRRLESIVVSRLKDVRDETEAKAMLEKPSKTGGLGFTPEQAAAILLLTSESVAKVAEAKGEAIKKKEEHGVLLQQATEAKERRAKELAERLKIVVPQAPPPPAPPPAPAVTKADLGLDTAADVKEVKKIEEELPKKIVPQEITEVATAMDSMVNEALSATGVAPPDQDLARRYKTLVTLYFRDLRDALETKSKFTMPVASGGMGMPDAEADRVMTILKEKVKGFSTTMEGRAAEGKAKFVTEQASKHVEAEALAERKEKEALDRQFKGLLEKTGAPASVAAAQRLTPPGPPRIVPVTGGDSGSGALPEVKPVPHAPSPTSVPAPAPTQAMPAAPPKPVVAPAPVTAAAAPATPPPPVAMPKPAPAPVGAQAVPVSAIPSVAPAMPASSVPSSVRPTVVDVKFAPKLIGPVEELRQLTLKDFRKLSKEPKEATLKIKDKIDLLEDQGFERKTEAIKAWQDSEVNKLYLDTLRKSLEGKPVTEVIAERELGGQMTLNKAEFDSIMELNRKLRFG